MNNGCQGTVYDNEGDSEIIEWWRYHRMIVRGTSACLSQCPRLSQTIIWSIGMIRMVGGLISEISLWS